MQVREKIWNPVFVSVFIATAAMNLGQQMINSLIAKYADHLGATATTVGFVVGIFAVTALVFKIFSAPAIDTFNKKYIVVGSAVVLAVAYVGYSLSSTIPALIVFRLLQGAGLAFSATCCLALAADALPPDKFGAGIGYFSIAQVAAQAVGPTVSLFFLDVFGYQTTFLIGAGIMLSAAVVALRIKTERAGAKKFEIRLKNVFAAEAVVPTALMFFLSMAFAIINSFLIVFAGRQGVDNIGYFFTVYAVTLIITRPLVGRLADRVGLVKVAIPSIILFASSFLIISISTSLPVFLLAAFVSALGFGTVAPQIQTLCMKSVPNERRGAGSSTVFIGTDVGMLIGPIIAGAIADRFGYVSMWRLMIIPIAAAILFLAVNRRRIRGIEADFAAAADE